MLKLKLLYKLIIIQTLLLIGFMISISMVNLPKIDKNIQKLEEKNAKNILIRVVELSNNSIRNLEEFKIRALENHKINLKNIIDIANSILENHYAQYTSGNLTENKAKKIAYKEIAKLKYGKFGYVFMLDDNYTSIAHPNKNVLGKNYATIKDIKGNYFVKEMVDKTRKEKEVYTTYWWEKTKGNIVEKLSFTKLFKPWNVYLGTGVYIDDIQKEIDIQKNKLFKQLANIIKTNDLGKNGYIYAFTKSGNIVIHPNKAILNTSIKQLINPTTSNNLYDDLVKASKTTKELRYKWDKIDDKENYIYDKIAWIENISSLDIYIASSIYIDDLKSTSAMLKTNILTFGILTLIIMIILSIIFIRKLLLPLNALIDSTKKIADGNYDAKLTIISNDEIGILSKNFNKMAKVVEDTIHNLDLQVEEKTQSLTIINRELEESEHEVVLINESLTEQKNAFENLYQKSSDGILIIKDGKFVDCNEAVVQMMKYNSKNEFLNVHPSKLSPQFQPDGRESFEKANEMMKIAIDTGSNSFEWIHVRADNEEFWAEIVLTQMIQNRESIIHVVWRDISKRKQIEFELEQLTKNLEQRVNEELEKNKLQNQQMLQQSRLAQMGEMISMIAHQWRQPLTAISSTTNSLLFKTMMNEKLEKNIFERDLKLINEYSQHLSKTIDDFRGFFKDNKTKEITTLKDIVNSILNIVKVSIENKGIKIITEIECSEEFETHLGEIKQVVLNIIKNAEDVLLENITKNPTITIKSIYDITNNHPTLIIKDNGGGIPENIMPKIFEPYFSTKLEKNGSGLGLYMSKTIIEEHCGGKLSVSNDDNGAVFKIVLAYTNLDKFKSEDNKINKG